MATSPDFSADTPTAEAPGELMRSAVGLIRQLAVANLVTIRLARELFRAQDAAHLQSCQLGPVIDEAAATQDPATVESAVRVAAAAEEADVREFELASRFGRHCADVLSLIDEVETELAAVPCTTIEPPAARVPAP